MGPDFQGGDGHMYSAVFAVVVAMTVLFLRNRRPRKLRVELLWIRPLIFLLIVGVTLAASPIPHDLSSLAVFALALIVGAGLGWQRGRLMAIDVDPGTHAMTVRASPLGMILILGVLGLRVILRDAALENRGALGVPTAAITDGLVLLLGAMIITQGLEMWLRSRRLLEEARAARDSLGSAQPPLVS